MSDIFIIPKENCQIIDSIRLTMIDFINHSMEFPDNIDNENELFIYNNLDKFFTELKFRTQLATTGIPVE